MVVVRVEGGDGRPVWSSSLTSHFELLATGSGGGDCMRGRCWDMDLRGGGDLGREMRVSFGGRGNGCGG